MATASILALYLGFSRDPAQRNRHTQIAAKVTASQTRLRNVSIDSIRRRSRRRQGLGPAPWPGKSWQWQTVYNGA